MDNETKEALLLLLNSSSDEDDFVFEEFFTNELSSDDSGDESETDAKNHNFMDTIDEYSEADFKSHLGLKRSTVEQLLTQYSQSIIFSNLQRGGKQKIGARREVYLYVWYIGNIITFEELGNLFGIAKSSAWNAVGRVSSWLVSKGSEYIKWPQGDAVSENCRRFKAKTKLAGVMGVINCTHITIAAPKQNKKRYFNSKHNYSLVLQAVVDSENKFIDICCGEPGSSHDGEVLLRSALYKRAQTNHDRMFPSRTFLLAGPAYDATSWLVQPYKDNDQITDRQRCFNSLHSDAMMVIEIAFELLKGRFRRLTSFTEQMNPDSLKKIIVSACILHNFCIINNDLYTEIKEEVNTDLPSEHKASSKTSLHTNRREILFDYLFEQNVI